ncbi:hypothetical protein ABZP36_022599 [Zizania latifolia]
MRKSGVVLAAPVGYCKCFGNLARKSGNPSDCSASSEKREGKKQRVQRLAKVVLEPDSTNVKAFYRRSQEHIHLVDLDLAELDIRRAVEIDPDNR